MDRLRLAYITSLRELSGDEQVGRSVIDAITGARYGYRAGTLERLVGRLDTPGDPMADGFELAAVVVDDDDEELAGVTASGSAWPDGLVPPDLLLRVPSSWRRMAPAPGEAMSALRTRKREAKMQYEARLRDALEARRVDVVLSDSYMVLFGPVMLDAFAGRILNVHPGVLDPGHPAHTPGHTPTRDAWTRAVGGFVIVDDKRVTPKPPGPVQVVDFEGAQRVAVSVPAVAITGVSVHIVTASVDAGRVIATERWRFDPTWMTPEWIRHVNYRVKHRVVPRALLQWAEGDSVSRPSIRRGTSPCAAAS